VRKYQEQKEFITSKNGFLYITHIIKFVWAIVILARDGEDII